MRRKSMVGLPVWQRPICRKMQDLPQIQKGHRCKPWNPAICGLSESAGGTDHETPATHRTRGAARGSVDIVGISPND